MIVTLNFTANRQILYCQFDSSFILSFFSTFYLAQFQFRCKFCIAVSYIIQIHLLRFCIHSSLSDFFIPFCFGLRKICLNAFNEARSERVKIIIYLKISENPSFVHYYFSLFYADKTVDLVEKRSKTNQFNTLLFEDTIKHPT